MAVWIESGHLPGPLNGGSLLDKNARWDGKAIDQARDDAPGGRNRRSGSGDRVAGAGGASLTASPVAINGIDARNWLTRAGECAKTRSAIRSRPTVGHG